MYNHSAPENVPHISKVRVYRDDGTIGPLVVPPAPAPPQRPAPSLPVARAGFAVRFSSCLTGEVVEFVYQRKAETTAPVE